MIMFYREVTNPAFNKMKDQSAVNAVYVQKLSRNVVYLLRSKKCSVPVAFKEM